MGQCRRIICLIAAITTGYSLGHAGPDFQAAKRLPKVDLLIGKGFPPDAFRNELARLGYRDGKNIRLHFVDAGPEYYENLKKREVDVVAVSALPWALLVKAAHPGQKMVIVTSPGIVKNGLAKSMGHPGGNITGIDELPPGLTAKRLTLLHIAAPHAKRIALLSATPGKVAHDVQLADAMAQAKKLGLSVKVYRVTTDEEVAPALEAIAKDGMQAMVSFQGGRILKLRNQIVEVVAKHKIPAIYQATMLAEAGGLMTWAPDLMEQFRYSARLVDRILRGENPGEIPIIYPKKYYLTVNLQAAKQIGLKLPKKLLAQADRIIP